jgi:hypothetical protein
VPLGGQPVAVAYAYSPGEEHDGVTVKLGFSLAQTVSQSCVEWSVPGLREGLVNELLRALPKSHSPRIAAVSAEGRGNRRELQATGESLQADLARFIRQRYGVAIPLNAVADRCDSRAPAAAHRSPRQRPENPRHQPRSQRAPAKAGAGEGQTRAG